MGICFAIIGHYIPPSQIDGLKFASADTYNCYRATFGVSGASSAAEKMSAMAHFVTYDLVHKDYLFIYFYYYFTFGVSGTKDEVEKASAMTHCVIYALNSFIWHYF